MCSVCSALISAKTPSVFGQLDPEKQLRVQRLMSRMPVVLTNDFQGEVE